VLYTTQIAKIHLLPKIIEPIDITVKSAVPPWNIFAPTWEMVSNFKSKKVDEVFFTDSYYFLMRSRYKKDKAVFRKIIDKAFYGNVALACYCPAGSFCHRYLLVEILQKIFPQLKYRGEIPEEKIQQPELF